MKKGVTSYLIVGGLVLAGIGLLSYQNIFRTGMGTERVPCNNVAIPDPSDLHWHPQLKMIVNGETVKIPANIGLSIQCHRVLHTHDDTGEIHIEPDSAQDFTLNDFMSVWGKPFSKTQLLDKAADAGHEIVMTVDGAPSEEYGALLLKDKQNIVIEYRARAAE